MSYDKLLRENTKGLLFRAADNLSDWTTGVEWQIRCDVCKRGLWAEDTASVPGQMPDERYCGNCAFQARKEMAMSR